MQVVVAENQQDLERLEGIIKKNFQSFVETAHAFREIRDKKYYCDVLGFDTFEEYCRKRWQTGRRYMNRLIAAGDVVENLGPMDPKPANERQVRPMTKLTPDLQRQVWQKVLDSAPDGKITEQKVLKVVKAITPKNIDNDEHPKVVKKDAANSEETEPGHLDLLKKHWEEATSSDREQFRLWIGQSMPTGDSNLVELPCVGCKCHENPCLSMQGTETADVDEAGMRAA